MGAARYLRSAAEPFDIVFLDPPFGSDAVAEYVPHCSMPGHGSSAGTLVYLENARELGVPQLPAHWDTAQIEVGG